MLEKSNGRRLAASLASSSPAHDQQHKFGAGKLNMFGLLQLRHSQDRWGRTVPNRDGLRRQNGSAKQAKSQGSENDGRHPAL